jgi:iron complex outermembrane recepter protein
MAGEVSKKATQWSKTSTCLLLRADLTVNTTVGGCGTRRAGLAKMGMLSGGASDESEAREGDICVMRHNRDVLRRGRSLAVRGWLLSSVSSLSALALLATGPVRPAAAQDLEPTNKESNTLPPVSVVTHRAKPKAPAQPGRPAPATTAPPPPTTVTGTETTATGPATPPAPGVNLGATPEVTGTNRLGLPVQQIPRSVDVVTRPTIEQQGYRTNEETAAGAVGVVAFDPASASGGFSMRGFHGDEMNILYNGINLGAQDLTGRTMSTFSFQQVEFLKGASALESGQGAIAGSVNYVNRLPTSGPIQNEAFIAFDSLHSVRSGYASSGSTPVPGLDYVFTESFDATKGFIDDTNKNLATLTTRINYRVSEDFKTWVAFEYYKDAGHYYWGTPLVSAAAVGPFALSGIVSGSETSHTNGSFLGPVAIDSRTLKTNYDSLDNFDGATQYWGRGGFEWQAAPNVTVTDQAYAYSAKRTFFDLEIFGFNSGTGVVDRFPFFVSHDQHLYGNIADVTWNSTFLGMPNRMVGELAASRNKIVFSEASNTSTDNASTLVDPARGFYGPLITISATSLLDTVSESLEDRLKVTPQIALIGGVRVDEMTLTRDHQDATGAEVAGYPFSTSWNPVSYRAGLTYEPIRNTTLYALYGTAYDPAVAAIFELPQGVPPTLTSSRIFEAGVKQSLWDNRFQWTFAVYDVDRRNVVEQIGLKTFIQAGDIDTKGVEIAGAVRPTEGLTLWGNVALVHARFLSDEFPINGVLTNLAGNTPPEIPDVVVNAGASYRFEKQPWWHWLPIEVGASVRHVGARYILDDDAIAMAAYTTADAYLFFDLDRPSLLPKVEKTRLSFRVRNLTNATYAAYTDSFTPDQIYLGEPRTYEAALSFKW